MEETNNGATPREEKVPSQQKRARVLASDEANRFLSDRVSSIREGAEKRSKSKFAQQEPTPFPDLDKDCDEPRRRRRTKKPARYQTQDSPVQAQDSRIKPSPDDLWENDVLRGMKIGLIPEANCSSSGRQQKTARQAFRRKLNSLWDIHCNSQGEDALNRLTPIPSIDDITSGNYKLEWGDSHMNPPTSDAPSDINSSKYLDTPEKTAAQTQRLLAAIRRFELQESDYQVTQCACCTAMWCEDPHDSGRKDWCTYETYMCTCTSCTSACVHGGPLKYKIHPPGAKFDKNKLPIGHSRKKAISVKYNVKTNGFTFFLRLQSQSEHRGA
jgi:hypothetical protein